MKNSFSLFNVQSTRYANYTSVGSGQLVNYIDTPTTAPSPTHTFASPQFELIEIEAEPDEEPRVTENLRKGG